MNVDIIFLVFLALLAAAPTFIGIEMTRKPPTETNNLAWRYRLAFGVVLVGTLVVVVLQATKNLHDQAKIQQAANSEQSKRDSQYYAVKAKLDLIQGFAENPPAGKSSAEIAAAIKTISHLNLPAGESTNAELKNKAWDVVKRMQQLDAQKQKDSEELLEYWKPGVPDTYERHRIQEFNGVDAKAAFSFRTYIAGDYVYLFQEILNRLPSSAVPEIPDKNVGTWLEAGQFLETGMTRLPYFEKEILVLANKLQ